jgi:hypothetical protein
MHDPQKVFLFAGKSNNSGVISEKLLALYYQGADHL